MDYSAEGDEMTRFEWAIAIVFCIPYTLMLFLMPGVFR